VLVFCVGLLVIFLIVIAVIGLRVNCVFDDGW